VWNTRYDDDKWKYILQISKEFGAFDSCAPAGSITDLTPGGVPDPSKYYYDPATGMLFFYVVQDLPNAVGPSPLGRASEHAESVRVPNALESYYACPRRMRSGDRET